MNKKGLTMLWKVIISLVIVGVGLLIFVPLYGQTLSALLNNKGPCGDSTQYVNNLFLSVEQVLSGAKTFDVEYINLQGQRLNLQGNCIIYGLSIEIVKEERYRPPKCYAKSCLCICEERNCADTTECLRFDDVDSITREGKPLLIDNKETVYITSKEREVTITSKRPLFLGDIDLDTLPYLFDGDPEEIGFIWHFPFNDLPGFTDEIYYDNDKFNYPGFEFYREDYYPERYKSIHRGIDIIAPAETPVKPIADGKITKVEDCVYVSHKGEGIYIDKEYTSIYCHVDSSKSYEGKEVKSGESSGDIIGLVRDLGESSHLHLEMYSKPVTVAAYSSYFDKCGCGVDSEDSLVEERTQGEKNEECDIKRFAGEEVGACQELDNDNYLIDPGRLLGLY